MLASIFGGKVSLKPCRKGLYPRDERQHLFLPLCKAHGQSSHNERRIGKRKEIMANLVNRSLHDTEAFGNEAPDTGGSCCSAGADEGVDSCGET